MVGVVVIVAVAEGLNVEVGSGVWVEVGKGTGVEDAGGRAGLAVKVGAIDWVADGPAAQPLINVESQIKITSR